jgi:MFS family permease
MKPKPTRLIHLLGLGTAFSILGDSTLYTVLPNPNIADSVGLSAVNVGWLLGVNRLARIIFNGPIGSLADRLPRRGMLLASLGVGVLSTMVYAFANTMVAWLVGRILWGLAWSGIWIVGQAALLDVSDDDTRGRLSGLFQTWFFIGVGGSALLAGLFTDWLGFRGGLYLSAALTAAAWVLWWRQIPETRPHRPVEETSNEAKVTLSELIGVIRLAMPVFAIRFVFAGVIASTTILWMEQVLPSLPGAFDRLVPLATLTGIMVATRTFSSVIGSSLVGMAADRFNWRWRLVALVLAIGAFGMWAMAESQWILAILGALLGAIAGSGVQTIVPALVGDRFELEESGRILGIIYTIGDLGSALGPPAAVALIASVSLLGVYRYSAIGLAVFASLALLEGLSKRRSIRNQPG